MTSRKQPSTRAESARIRRDKRKRQPASSARSGHDTPARRTPPVMVRGGGGHGLGQSKPERKRKTVKRRFDIALSSPGVEIRLPSMPVVRTGWRLASFILVIGMLVLLSHLWNSPNYQVQTAEVQGALRLTGSDINRVLNVYNKSIFAVNPRQMENALRMAYPGLADVSVQVGLPATVLVTINERIPVLAWQQDANIQWVDADGIAFPPRGEVVSLVWVDAYAAPPLPLRDAAAPSLDADVVAAPQAFMSPELVSAILMLGAQAPEGAPLVYDPGHGLGWNDARGWDVYFGMDVADVETKHLVYQAVAERLQADGIQPALINVEHVHAPYYRLER